MRKEERKGIIKSKLKREKNYNKKSLSEKLFAIKYYIQWIKYWMFWGHEMN